MPLLATSAIVLHAFDYLESSRILRLVTREGGVRSVLAKGARRSSRRFGSAVDLFAEGSAQLYVKAGRDLDNLSAFDVERARPELSQDLGRFAGASAIAELTLRFGRDDTDASLFDVVANNSDRKGGHLLPIEGGHVYGCDHGLTFHQDTKLRTVLWGWRGMPLSPEEHEVLDRIAAGLGSGGTLRAALEEHLTRREVGRTARRVDELLAAGCFPHPSEDWPAIPWPPF